MEKLTPSEGYRWIAQDEDGEIYEYKVDPKLNRDEWIVVINCFNFISGGKTNPNWKESKVDTETHDAYIVDGILISEPKEVTEMTTNTTKQTIEVDVPEGWEVVRYGVPEKGEYFISVNLEPAHAINSGVELYRVIIRKKKPIRRTFELVSDARRCAVKGEYYSEASTLEIWPWDLVSQSSDAYYIWKEIEGEDND